MARIRSIKPEVRISVKVNSWPIEVRYFWVLLWGYCDDYGYGRDNSRLIVADAFPLDDSITAETVAEWMDTLWRDEVIERFMVDDSPYFRVINWDEHQKISHPAKRILPDISEATEVLARPSEKLPSVTETFEKVSPKQGAGSREMEQGAGEQVVALIEPIVKPNMTVLFDAAYAHWPKKVKRDAALERFKTACQKQSPETLARTIATFGDAYRAATTKQFTPALDVWLNQKRWSDDLPTPESVQRKPTRGDQNLAFVTELHRQQQANQLGIES